MCDCSPVGEQTVQLLTAENGPQLILEVRMKTRRGRVVFTVVVGFFSENGGGFTTEKKMM